MSRKITKNCLLIMCGLLVLAWAVLVQPAPDKDSSDGVLHVAAADPTGTDASPVPTGTTPSPVPTGTTPSPVPTGATNTPTPTPTASPASEGIAETYVEYADEQISVKVKAANTQVYYAILKNNTVTGVKLAELLPAAQNANGMFYYIDISTLSASKVNYVGITTVNTPGADGLVPVVPVTVSPNQKKIIFNVDWSYEGTPTQFSGLKILQDTDRFCFGMDAVVLSGFVKVKNCAVSIWCCPTSVTTTGLYSEVYAEIALSTEGESMPE